MSTIPRSLFDEGEIMFNLCKTSNLTQIKDFLKNSYHSNEYLIDSGLMGACEGGKLDTVICMINSGAISFDGALYYACKANRLELAKLMINSGATNFDLGLKSACYYSHIQMVEFIASYGETDVWERAFLYACKVDNKEIVQYIINKLDQSSGPFYVGFLIACEYSNTEVIALLIDYSHVRNNLNKGIVKAFEGGYKNITKCIELLIRHGADPNKCIENIFTMHFIHSNFYFHVYFHTLRFLIMNGADYDRKKLSTKENGKICFPYTKFLLLKSTIIHRLQLHLPMHLIDKIFVYATFTYNQTFH